MIYWLTGPPNTGKTTMAKYLGFFMEGRHPNKQIELIDCPGLPEDMPRLVIEKRIRQVQSLARMYNAVGMVVIISMESPYLEIREEFKQEMGEDIVEISMWRECIEPAASTRYVRSVDKDALIMDVENAGEVKNIKRLIKKLERLAQPPACRDSG